MTFGISGDCNSKVVAYIQSTPAIPDGQNLSFSVRYCEGPV